MVLDHLLSVSVCILVTVNDDDPQAGYCTLILDTPGLKVKKALIGPSKPENAEVAVELKDK